MVSLREEITKRFQKNKQTEEDRRRNGADAQLQRLANKLQKEMGRGDFVRWFEKNPKEEQRTFDVGDLGHYIATGGDAKTLGGYKRLHEMFSLPQVDMKLEITSRREPKYSHIMGHYATMRWAIVITPDVSYSESPDAGFFRGELPPKKELPPAPARPPTPQPQSWHRKGAHPSETGSGSVEVSGVAGMSR